MGGWLGCFFFVVGYICIDVYKREPNLKKLACFFLVLVLVESGLHFFEYFLF